MEMIRESDEETGDVAISGGELTGKCPMNCCFQSKPTTGVMAAEVIVDSPKSVPDTPFQFFPVVFESTGFSSHTDRGPPIM